MPVVEAHGQMTQIKRGSTNIKTVDIGTPAKRRPGSCAVKTKRTTFCSSATLTFAGATTKTSSFSASLRDFSSLFQRWVSVKLPVMVMQLFFLFFAAHEFLFPFYVLAFDIDFSGIFTGEHDDGYTKTEFINLLETNNLHHDLPPGMNAGDAFDILNQDGGNLESTDLENWNGQGDNEHHHLSTTEWERAWATSIGTCATSWDDYRDEHPHEQGGLNEEQYNAIAGEDGHLKYKEMYDHSQISHDAHAAVEKENLSNQWTSDGGMEYDEYQIAAETHDLGEWEHDHPMTRDDFHQAVGEHMTKEEYLALRAPEGGQGVGGDLQLLGRTAAAGALGLTAIKLLSNKSKEKAKAKGSREEKEPLLGDGKKESKKGAGKKVTSAVQLNSKQLLPAASSEDQDATPITNELFLHTKQSVPVGEDEQTSSPQDHGLLDAVPDSKRETKQKSAGGGGFSLRGAARAAREVASSAAMLEGGVLDNAASSQELMPFEGQGEGGNYENNQNSLMNTPYGRKKPKAPTSRSLASQRKKKSKSRSKKNNRGGKDKDKPTRSPSSTSPSSHTTTVDKYELYHKMRAQYLAADDGEDGDYTGRSYSRRTNTRKRAFSHFKISTEDLRNWFAGPSAGRGGKLGNKNADFSTVWSTTLWTTQGFIFLATVLVLLFLFFRNKTANNTKPVTASRSGEPPGFKNKSGPAKISFSSISSEQQQDLHLDPGQRRDQYQDRGSSNNRGHRASEQRTTMASRTHFNFSTTKNTTQAARKNSIAMQEPVEQGNHRKSGRFLEEGRAGGGTCK